ncbi:glycosyltransferase [Scytonema sp. UIC 10036]|uniref:glycosyltransferase n=1 Tax=Scytonema sp. UIC 10036 TaxID=2304196 RepID=UPI001FA9BC49|nr:glycosyltransferase [Scytonema sp. UIC 10036]
MQHIVLSVIICTHNPRLNYLERVLQALKNQTLPTELWELLLIDNASDKLLSSEVDLSWHPQSRYIREEKLGLTPARLRGIKETVAETLVFVDDDNVLDSDYLEVASKISKDWPILGAWGGQIRPEFEEIPPDWTKPYWGALAIKEFDQDMWSNLLEAIPTGAGMCVRKIIAQKYSELTHNNQKRLLLDRRGKLLTSAGDLDLARTTRDLNLGTGLFVALKLTHLIPAYRLQEKYLIRWLEGNSYSCTILNYIRGEVPPPVDFTWVRKLIDLYRLLRMKPRQRRFHQAWQRGRMLAIKEIL